VYRHSPRRRVHEHLDQTFKKGIVLIGNKDSVGVLHVEEQQEVQQLEAFLGVYVHAVIGLGKKVDMLRDRINVRVGVHCRGLELDALRKGVDDRRRIVFKFIVELWDFRK